MTDFELDVNAPPEVLVDQFLARLDELVGDVGDAIVALAIVAGDHPDLARTIDRRLGDLGLHTAPQPTHVHSLRRRHHRRH